MSTRRRPSGNGVLALCFGVCVLALPCTATDAADWPTKPVHVMVAERKQLREFLMKHYPVPQFLAQYSEKL